MALPPMTGGTRTCLSVVLLEIRVTIGYQEGKNITYIVKPSFVVQDKLICHENSWF